MVGLLQAPYGTRLYERMQQEDRLTGAMTGDNVDGSTNIIPRMGLEPLRQGYRWLLDQIYSPPYYYARLKTFLREYQAPAVSLHIEPQYILAFFRSVYQLGLRGSARAPVLGALVLDALPASRVVPAGGHDDDLRLPFPPGGRATACSSNRRAAVERRNQ